MKIKKIAAFTLSAFVAGGAVAAGIYCALTRDPTSSGSVGSASVVRVSLAVPLASVVIENDG